MELRHSTTFICLNIPQTEAPDNIISTWAVMFRDQLHLTVSSKQCQCFTHIYTGHLYSYNSTRTSVQCLLRTFHRCSAHGSQSAGKILRTPQKDHVKTSMKDPVFPRKSPCNKSQCRFALKKSSLIDFSQTVFNAKTAGVSEDLLTPLLQMLG